MGCTILRNVVSTMVSSRAYSPRVALGVTILAEFSGPFIFGSAVANTIGRGIADPGAISLRVILVALVSAVIWNLFTWKLKIPSSSSHALIGGIVGAVSAGVGAQAIQMGGLLKILISLFASPIIGFVFRIYCIEDHLRPMCGLHSPYQPVLQEEPDRHCPCAGIEPWQ